MDGQVFKSVENSQIQCQITLNRDMPLTIVNLRKCDLQCEPCSHWRSRHTPKQVSLGKEGNLAREGGEIDMEGGEIGEGGELAKGRRGKKWPMDHWPRIRKIGSRSIKGIV